VSSCPSSAHTPRCTLNRLGPSSCQSDTRGMAHCTLGVRCLPQVVDALQKRHGTWWRLYKLLPARFDAILIAQWNWRRAAVPACLHVLMERPRRRTLPSLPSRVVELQPRLDALPATAESMRNEYLPAGGWRLWDRSPGLRRSTQ
jgi:hypothetical protein